MDDEPKDPEYGLTGWTEEQYAEAAKNYQAERERVRAVREAHRKRVAERRAARKAARENKQGGDTHE